MWPFTSSYPVLSAHQILPEYDYIVVGGGTGGCVLARRLSENKDCTVLLVERGDAADTWIDRVPLFSSYFWSDRKHGVVLNSTLDTQLGREVPLVTGHGLGGTSRINSMKYSRGAPAEYNAWSKSGCEGWSYAELKDYFTKSERSLDHTSDDYHGVTGVWQIRKNAEYNFKCSESAAKAAEKLGFLRLDDLNTPNEPIVGCYDVHFAIDSSGYRHSTFRAFLPPEVVASCKDNLHICIKTIVVKLDLVPESNDSIRVDGVQLQTLGQHGTTLSVKARREVILAGGALRTPQILMLSGIGPQDHLLEIGIPVIKHLGGVGNHLDHLGVHVDYNCPMSDSLYGMVKSPTILITQIYRYIMRGKGWLLAPLVEACIFARSSFLKESGDNTAIASNDVDPSVPENLPDIEIMTSPITDPRFPEFDKSKGVFAFLVALLRPESKGSVRLKSSDPLEEPICDMRYLTEPNDFATLRAALRLTVRWSQEMRAAGYPLEDVHVPDPSDDSVLDAFIHRWADSYYHYSSTCRMAPENGPEPGVVDSQLRVHGIPNLRIADASVFPQIPATHPMAPVVVVAEKCADMIRTTHVHK